MDDDLTIRRDSLLAQLLTSGYRFVQDAPETNPLSRRFEDLIAETVWPYAKMVAIGRPGDVLPRLGALRMQVDPSAEEWRKAVQRLLAAARHVLIAVGISSGLKWEFSQFEAGASPLKLSLIIVPEQGSVAATWRIFARDYQNCSRCLSTSSAAWRCGSARMARPFCFVRGRSPPKPIGSP